MQPGHLGDVGVVHVAGQEGDRARRTPRACRRPPARPSRPPSGSTAGRRPSARGRPPGAGVSPTRLPARPHAPSARASLHASRWCSPSAAGTAARCRRAGGRRHRVIWPSSQAISASSSIGRSSGSSTRAARESTTTSRVSPMSRAVAPPVALRVLVDPVGEPVERLGEVGLTGSVVAGDELPDLVVGPLLRRQVPQVLVDPVRREPGDDPVVPPRGLLHLLAPRRRGVPVVADVVVVEDHRARQRRQQPPVRGVAPGQRVEVGVLLVVLQLLAGRLVDVTSGGDELLHLGGRLVGVHLVAEEDDQVRPRQLLAGSVRPAIASA